MSGSAELIVLDTVDSTNAYAKRLAEAGAVHGTAVLARAQTAGRGRLGRRFASPEGKGMYLSVILRPRQAAADATAVTLEAAVVAAEELESATRAAGAEISVGIKWVNDLFVGGKKIAGILCEGALAQGGKGLAYAIVGIGINLLSGGLPPELKEIATTVQEQAGVCPDAEALAQRIVRALLSRSDRLGEGLAEYRRRQILFGKTVTVTRGSERFLARPSAVTDRGELVVVRPDGTREILTAGEVTLHRD